MPLSRRWSTLLADTLGKPSAKEIVRSARLEYEHLLAAGSPIPIKVHTLRNNLKTRIFPGLAIYRALIPSTPDVSSRLAIVESLFRADYFGGMSHGIRLMNNLPDPFPLIRPVLRMMTSQPYLPGSQVLVEDSPDCFAIDTHRCFILDVLTALEAREMTAIFCKTDDWLSEELPKVHWLRTKTLAQGDEKCDFRWCRRISVTFAQSAHGSQKTA
jgi:hypothetical protein